MNNMFVITTLIGFFSSLALFLVANFLAMEADSIKSLVEQSLVKQDLNSRTSLKKEGILIIWLFLSYCR